MKPVGRVCLTKSRSILAGILAGALLAGLAAPSRAEQRVGTRLLIQESYVAGYRYHDARKVWKDLHIGDRLDLVREPGNPFDPNAVRVDWQGYRLGYVPRLDNEGVSRQLDLGAPLEARIVRLKKSRSPRQRIWMEIYTGVSG